MKKILLSLGTISLVVAPITILVSCGDSKKTIKRTVVSTTTSAMKEKVDNALDKLSNIVNSTNTSSQLSTSIGSKIANDPVEVSLLGLPNNFSVVDDGLSISYTINTAYNNTERLVKLNVKISSIEDTSISSTKIITVNAATFDFSADKAKFIAIQSTKTATELAHDVSDVNNISNVELGIENPTSLTNGLTITYSIQDKNFTGTTAKTVIAHLNYDDQTDTTTFKLIPKYDFTSDKAKFNSPIVSTKTASELTTVIGEKLTGLTATQLGIVEPSLSNGTTVTYSIDDKNFTSTTTKTVTVHLTYDDQTDTTTFKLTPKYDFTSDKAKFNSPIVSIKIASELTTAVGTHLTGLTAAQLGLNEPTISTGTTITYSIDDKNFTGTTAKTVTVHLTYDDQTDTTTFKLIPKYDFTSDKTKFNSPIVSTKIATELTTAVGEKLTGLTATQLGFVEPSLSTGVTATYSIDDKNFIGTTTKTVTVHLTYDGQIDTTTFNLTPKYDFTSDKAKFNNLIASTKTASELIAAIGTHLTGLTATQLGFVEPSLADGVTATYSIDDKNFTGTTTKTVIVHLIHTSSGSTDITSFGLAIKQLHWALSKTLKNLLDGSTIRSMVSDGHGGTLIGGQGGQINHIDANGDLVNEWSTISLLGGNNSIYSIAPDGNGGFWVGGSHGKLDHINAHGNLVNGWTTKTLLGGSNINSIISDGHGGAFVGGSLGKLDHIDPNGNLVAGWTTKTLIRYTTLYAMATDGHNTIAIASENGVIYIDLNGDVVSSFVDALPLYTIVSDGHGGFLAGSIGGKIYKFDSECNLVVDWKQKTFIAGDVIHSIISDGNDGFWVGGSGGKIDHIDANGNLVAGWNGIDRYWIDGGMIRAMTPDGHGGAFVGGDFGKLDHIDVNGNKPDGWKIVNLINDANINVIQADGHGFFFVGGNNGRLYLIDANGEIIKDWTQNAVTHHININSIIPDGSGGFWVRGDGGNLFHITYS